MPKPWPPELAETKGVRKLRQWPGLFYFVVFMSILLPFWAERARYPSLAHRGVLFLDELPEFGSRMLEMLRQPLDPTGKLVSISRSAGSLTYAANFTLIGSMNPCPCGYHGGPVKECTCSMSIVVKNYQKRISGPLMDRIEYPRGGAAGTV